jgi:transcriptional regulator with XRE-family HTH domain
MNTSQTARLLQVHAECGVPLQHSVALLFKTKGLSLNAFAKRAGYQRTYLYKALSGSLSPSPGLREAMVEALGVDPWIYPGHQQAARKDRAADTDPAPVAANRRTQATGPAIEIQRQTP